MAFLTPSVSDTLQMLDIEQVSIRSLNLGVSLRDCSSRLPQTVRARAYDKIRRTGLHFVNVVQEIEGRYGVRVFEKSVSTTPIALVSDGASQNDFIALAQTLDTAAAHLGVDGLSGFAAFVEQGMTKGDEAFIAALPEALAATKRLHAAVNCGTSKAGLNADAVLKMAKVFKESARLTANQDHSHEERLAACCNLSPFATQLPIAYHDTGAAEAVLNVGLSGPGLLSASIRDAGEKADFETLAEAIKRTAFKATRACAFIGQQCAHLLTARTGQPITFGAVDLTLTAHAAEHGTITALMEAMGLDGVGAPGTTAAWILLQEAVRKGGAMAAAQVTQFCHPVNYPLPFSMREAEDPGLLIVPRDESVETLAGRLLDVLAMAMANGQVASVRILPVAGRPAGDYPDSQRLVRRGGHFPSLF